MLLNTVGEYYNLVLFALYISWAIVSIQRRGFLSLRKSFAKALATKTKEIFLKHKKIN